MPDGGIADLLHAASGAIGDDPELEDGDYVELAIARHRHRHGPRTCWRAPSSPSSPPRKSARAPALACRWSMASPASRAARRGSTATPGEGTTVRSILPPRRARRRGAGRRRASRRRKARAAARASVLVIDDDPDVREFIAASLDEYGYAVREAADGRDGPRKRSPTSGRTWSSSISSCRGWPAPRSRRGCCATRRASRSCSSPAITRPRRSAPPRPTRQLLAKPFRPDALDAAVRECLDSQKANGGKKPAA